MDVIVGRGRGFRTTEEKDRGNYDLGTIVVDSIYSPIKDVGYHVEYTRVGDITNYEKLTISIETNGTISPKDAIFQSTQILMDHFSIILDESKKDLGEAVVAEVAEEEPAEEEVTEEKPKKKAAKKKTK
jgi:DNA-directed RNA polymerase subunit alpha